MKTYNDIYLALRDAIQLATNGEHVAVYEKKEGGYFIGTGADNTPVPDAKIVSVFDPSDLVFNDWKKLHTYFHNEVVCLDIDEMVIEELDCRGLLL